MLIVFCAGIVAAFYLMTSLSGMFLGSKTEEGKRMKEVMIYIMGLATPFVFLLVLWVGIKKEMKRAIQSIIQQGQEEIIEMDGDRHDR